MAGCGGKGRAGGPQRYRRAVWEVTGARNQTSTHVNAGIRKLAQERGGAWALLRKGYNDTVQLLHTQAFYNGFYDDDIPALVRGDVAEYIRRAEALAG